jgi:hypothetical protein
MKTKTVALVALVVLLGLGSLPDAVSALRVRPANHRGLLTRSQEEELFRVLLNQHPEDPSLAAKVFAQAIIIDPFRADRVIVKITEEQAGEILPCVAVVVQGGEIAPPFPEVTTLEGDGLFEGPPEVFQGCGFQIMMFHGTRSTQVPLKLEVPLEFPDFRELRDCIDRAKELLLLRLAQCDALPPSDQAACRQSALDQYRANADRCHQAPR